MFTILVVLCVPQMHAYVKLIKFCTLSLCSLLYINYISRKLLKDKAVTLSPSSSAEGSREPTVLEVD